VDYDLVIVGGGLVGASLALALREVPMRIALIDARLPSHDDPRLFALNDSSCELLKKIKLWSELASHSAAIQQVHVSHRGYFGSVKLNAGEINLSSLGQVIPACYIEAAFHAHLTSASNVTLYQPATLTHLTQENNQATLTIRTTNGVQTLSAPIVVAADGADSTVRSQLNIAVEINDYQQQAIVTRTKLQRSHYHIAYERFVEQGAIAMLPLLDDECATIWSGEEKFIFDLMLLDDLQFLQQLQKQFGYRLGRLQSIKQRHIFPLRMVKAKKIIDGCVMLLGNAAHALHPIAAQGFNLALYEVAILVEEIMLKVAQKTRLTSKDLQAVQSKIEKHCQNSLRVSNQLADLFSTQSILINSILQIGMIGLNLATPIKSKFIQSMLGRKNQVPRLLSTSE